MVRLKELMPPLVKSFGGMPCLLKMAEEAMNACMLF